MGKPQTSNDPWSDSRPYELEAFMEKHNLSKGAAEVILRANGPSHHRCDHAAKAYNAVKFGDAELKPSAPSIRG
ncbi:hypothetical protein [Mesorhizobium sp. 128a]